MRPVDFSYTITDEKLVEYAAVPLIDRLRWLEELAIFTAAWRAAPRAPVVAAPPGDERANGSP
jgi:hypothetical protein